MPTTDPETLAIALRALSESSRLAARVDAQTVVMVHLVSAATPEVRARIAAALNAATAQLRKKDPTDEYLEAFLTEAHRYRAVGRSD